MSGLTISQRLKIIRAAVLLQSSSEVLAPFEIDLVEDVDRRHRRLGAAAEVTEREWPAIEAAIAAMAEHRGCARRHDAKLLMHDVTVVEAIGRLSAPPLMPIGPGDVFSPAPHTHPSRASPDSSGVLSPNPAT